MTVAEKKAYLRAVCGRWGILLRKESVQNASFLYGGIRCNSWLCPRCRKRKAAKFASATLAFFKGSRLSHLTITDRPDLSPRESFRTFAARWNHFRTLVTRGGRKFSYIRVLEQQPGTRRAHYHILTKEYISPTLLATSLKAAGFGPIYKIHECSDVEAFYYVRKYLVKEWESEEAFQLVVDYNLRLISGSRGFRLSPKIAQGWELVLKLTNHSYGRRFVKTLIFSAGALGAILANHTQTDLTDRFDFELSSAFGPDAPARFFESLDAARFSMIRSGVCELNFEDLEQYIDSQLGIDTATGCIE